MILRGLRLVLHLMNFFALFLNVEIPDQFEIRRYEREEQQRRHDEVRRQVEREGGSPAPNPFGHRYLSPYSNQDLRVLLVHTGIEVPIPYVVRKRSTNSTR